MPEVDVQTEIVIHRPISEVSAFAGNPDNVTKWYQNIRTVEWKSPRPLVVGSLITFVAYFLGRRLAYTYEVVALSLPDRLVMRTGDGPFPMETTYTWHEEHDGASTLMRLRNRGNAEGFASVTAPFMSSMIRKANRKDLQTLKELLEHNI